MRHVVLAMSASNKTTAERFGGVGGLSPEFDDELIYVYTIAVKEKIF
jgi:hypothetical protein